jgi:hypothetical protein
MVRGRITQNFSPPLNKLPVGNRDTDAFYQLGNLVTAVTGVEHNPSKRQITFQSMRTNSSINPSRNVVYRDWILRCGDEDTGFHLQHYPLAASPELHL